MKSSPNIIYHRGPTFSERHTPDGTLNDGELWLGLYADGINFFLWGFMESLVHEILVDFGKDLIETMAITMDNTRNSMTVCAIFHSSVQRYPRTEF